MATDPNAIIAAARGWIGTPYIHQASLKGVGCDCLGLLRGVWRELKGEDAETPPAYSPDWAEGSGQETLYLALKRHLVELPATDFRPGNVVLFRMVPHGPAKHCGIVAKEPSFGVLTLIHARQNKQVSEEAFTTAWQRKAAFVFEVPFTSSSSETVGQS